MAAYSIAALKTRGAMSMTGLTASTSTTARLISAPIRRSTQTIRPPTTRRLGSACRAAAISKRSETARPSHGHLFRREPVAAARPTCQTTCTRILAGVFSASAATPGMMLRAAACSFSVATAIRPTRARASARASFTSPNGGPGAAAPVGFRFQSGAFYALARQRHSLYIRAKRGAYIFSK